jgi:hypothetical protein
LNFDIYDLLTWYLIKQYIFVKIYTTKRLCKICKIKPPYLNFQWFIGPSFIYVARQQRTKWNHSKINFSYLSRYIFVKLYALLMSFPFQKYILIFLFIVMPRPQQQVSYAQYFTVYLMDLLFNQVEIFYNNILAETSYHLIKITTVFTNG